MTDIKNTLALVFLPETDEDRAAGTRRVRPVGYEEAAPTDEPHLPGVRLLGVGGFSDDDFEHGQIIVMPNQDRLAYPALRRTPVGQIQDMLNLQDFVFRPDVGRIRLAVSQLFTSLGVPFGAGMPFEKSAETAHRVIAGLMETRPVEEDTQRNELARADIVEAEAELLAAQHELAAEHDSWMKERGELYDLRESMSVLACLTNSEGFPPSSRIPASRLTQIIERMVAGKLPEEPGDALAEDGLLELVKMGHKFYDDVRIALGISERSSKEEIIAGAKELYDIVADLFGEAQAGAEEKVVADTGNDVITKIHAVLATMWTTTEELPKVIAELKEMHDFYKGVVHGLNIANSAPNNKPLAGTPKKVCDSI